MNSSEGLINEEIQCAINIKSKGQSDHCMAIIGKAFFETIDDEDIHINLLHSFINKWDEHYKEIVENIDTNDDKKKTKCKTSHIIESKFKNILQNVYSAHKKDNNNNKHNKNKYIKNNQENKYNKNNQENSDEDDDINDTTTTTTIKKRKTNEDAVAKKEMKKSNNRWYSKYKNCKKYVMYICYCEFAFYVDLIIYSKRVKYPLTALLTKWEHLHAYLDYVEETYGIAKSPMTTETKLDINEFNQWKDGQISMSFVYDILFIYIFCIFYIQLNNV